MSNQHRVVVLKDPPEPAVLKCEAFASTSGRFHCDFTGLQEKPLEKDHAGILNDLLCQNALMRRTTFCLFA